MTITLLILVATATAVVIGLAWRDRRQRRYWQQVDASISELARERGWTR